MADSAAGVLGSLDESELELEHAVIRRAAVASVTAARGVRRLMNAPTVRPSLDVQHMKAQSAVQVH
jgi:hypothetical protein